MYVFTNPSAQVACDTNSIYKRVWFSLVWFYGTSTIVGYLMPNPFLYRSI